MSITDKIKQLPDGKDLYIFKPVGLKTDDPHTTAFRIDGLTTDELKELRDELETARKALEEIRDWTGNDHAMRQIATDALSNEEPWI